MSKLQEIVSALRSKNDFIILTHEFPDGDTLGSAFALFHTFTKLGKRARVMSDSRIPKKYDFLFDSCVVKESPILNGGFMYVLSKDFLSQSFLYENSSSCVICVDVADPKLLGKNLSCYKNSIDICIDHHAQGKPYADLTYVDPSAAATAEIIFEIIKLLDVDFDMQIADCIYTGILTDTGSFKHINTTARTHEIAAQLLNYNARYNLISRKIEEKTKERIVLEKLVLESIRFFYENRCAVIFINKSMLEASGTSDDDTGGFAGIPNSIRGVIIGITIREKENSEFKVSLRSDISIDSSKICRRFGGGGHPCAAGFTISGKLEDVLNKIIKEVGDFI